MPSTVSSSATAQQHDDVIKWKYFPRYWTFVRGIHRSPVNSPHKGQWRGTLIFSSICAWINCWGWWFETPSCSLSHQCNEIGISKYVQFLWLFGLVIFQFFDNPCQSFTHIRLGCFTGTGTVVWLCQCQWSIPEWYGYNRMCHTTIKHNKPYT